MTDRFVGLTILVTLTNPPNAKVRGLVTSVVNQQLTLRNVTWLPTGTHLESFVIRGDQVQDLEIEPQPAPQPAPPKQPVQAPLDPAILSFTRHPTSAPAPGNGRPNQPGIPSQEFHSPPVSQPSDSEHHFAHSHNQQLNASYNVSPLGASSNQGERLAAATLTEPFSELSMNGRSVHGQGGPTSGPVLQGQSGQQLNTNLQMETIKPKGKGKRGKRAPKQGAVAAATQDAMNTALEGSNTAQTIDRGPGWRQTPIIESFPSPTPQPSHTYTNPLQDVTNQEQEPNATKRRSRAKQRNRARRNDFDDQNGWATEEVTDIQELGDFDFEGNLSKFDKKKVFAQIREEDTTADEARLVSFNRIAHRPGTYGGKNLHFTENVLDSPVPKQYASSSSEDDLENDRSRISSRNSHRNRSHASARKVPSRKGSALANDLHMVAPGSFPDTGTERFQRPLMSSTFLSSSSTRGSKGSGRKHGRTLHTGHSSRECPCLSPLQMIELEQLLVSTIGITDDMISENAASAIAQTARKLCLSQFGQRSFDGDKPPRPFIVVMAGNHKTGSRAIAGARHLRNHNAQVLLCILGLERESDLLEDVRRQLNIYRHGGGKVVSQDQFSQRLKGSTVNFIVDALFGIHISFHDLRHDDQAAYLQLLRWSNSTNALTLSIDIPAGVDASTGAPSLHGGSEIVIMADYVLALGAPKNGLVLGMEKTDSFKNHLSWFVADIGIPNAAWKKFTHRRQQGVDFGWDWVTALEFGDDTAATVAAV